MSTIPTPHLSAVSSSITPHESTSRQHAVMPTSDSTTWPRLQNVVSTFSMDCRLDLHLLAKHARNIEYNPKRFAAAIMRIRNPKTTALIFSNGKVVVTGAKSVADAQLAARKYVRIVQKLGFSAKFESFVIRNMVACGAALPQIARQKGDKKRGIVRQKHWVRLEGFVHRHSKFATYDPEIFAGCVYQMHKPKLVSRT